MTSITLMVFFEEPYWIGFLTRMEDEKQSVSRIVFGAEPSDQQVYQWILSEYDKTRFSPSVESDKMIRLASNPKRRQRQAAKELTRLVGTKSHMALQLAYEESKQERKMLSKAAEEEKAERKYFLQQEKKKAKHRGH